MPSPGERLVELIRAEPVDARAIGAFLDGLAPAERREAIGALSGPRLQSRLYRAVENAPRVTLADFVPPDAPPLREVIFHGKNSLPAFTLFQKRFCRPPRAAGELWGYNHQTLAWLTGPGYFVVHEDGARGAAIDYRQVPPDHPAGWPDVRPNDRGFSRFVYDGMVDYMRRVARDVFIGAAHRGGKELGNYFVLAREPG
ncbi:MAG TPA: hypothetical protein VKA21_14470 [Candidatus Binatia bacterium]|nr:hypothetical protein [Candidatus Binatia bacterium]